MKKQRFKIRLLPVVVYSALVILIVRAHSYNIGFDNMPDIPLDSSTQQWDVFSYAKSNAIFVITIWAALTLAYLLIVGRIKIKKTPIYIPVFVYSAGVIASYVMSDYKWMAFNGSVDRFEGTRTVICYMFMLFYTINVVDELRDVLYIVYANIASSFFTCLIGITQLLKKDFFLSDFADALVTGNSNISIDGTFLPGNVYQTVSNMNYVGMYLSLIIPILVFGLIFLRKKENRQILLSNGIDNRRRNVIISCIVLLLIMIALNMYGAGSLGGAVGICSSIAILLIVLIEKKWQKVTFIVTSLIMFSGLITYMYVSGVDDHTNTGHKRFDYIETGVDYVNMSIDGNAFTIFYDKNDDEFDNFRLVDSDNKSVNLFYFAGEDRIIGINDHRFGAIRIIPLKDINGEACAIVEVRDINRESFGFTFYEDGAKYLNPFGQEISLEKISSCGFTNHLSAGSGRGYIWSRTIPLLKDRLLIGSGADTFMLVFPQNDYAGKYTSGTPLNITFDKPHNMYLNMAVGTGVLSMVAFLSIIGMSLWRVFQLGKEKQFVKVVAAGIIGLLIAGIFNDSTVCIMPMFYSALGTIIAMTI